VLYPYAATILPDLFTQIFEDGASYRGQLKTKCRTCVASYYSTKLKPTSPGHGAYVATVMENAAALRAGGSFMHGGLDAKVLVVC
jgi:hypothetical protein